MPTAYITVPPEAADDLAAALVERGVAACVNSLDCRSTFRWDGEIQHETEVVLLAKTTDDRYDDLVAVVEERHPHEVPCIERFDESHVFEPFARWRDDCVQ